MVIYSCYRCFLQLPEALLSAFYRAISSLLLMKNLSFRAPHLSCMCAGRTSLKATDFACIVETYRVAPTLCFHHGERFSSPTVAFGRGMIVHMDRASKTNVEY